MSGQQAPAEELAGLSAHELIRQYRARTLSPVEVLEAIERRIEALDPELHAFQTRSSALAREQARAAERAYREGDARPLLGVPMAIKDVLPTRGIRTTCGSPLLADWVPDDDAPVVERVREAGAVILGKTCTSEFGWKATTNSLVSPPTRNPWDGSRGSGGSSGGSAVAVAAGMGPLALGTDGAGSIRIPASFCGVVGLKPSYGLVPHHPIAVMGNLSHIGPMARDVRDCALLLDVIAGADVRDPHSWSSGVTYADRLDDDVSRLRVGWCASLPYQAASAQVARVAEDAACRLRDAGCRLEPVEWAVDDPWDTVKTLWAGSNASRHVTDLAEVRDRIDPDRVALIEAGLRTSSGEFAAALRAASAYTDRLTAALKPFDILLLPTVGCPPLGIDEDYPAGGAAGARPLPLGWAGYTYPFNVTGQPAASVPCGFDDDGLAVGLQIVGRRRDDLSVLRFAAFAERSFSGLSRRVPVRRGW